MLEQSKFSNFQKQHNRMKTLSQQFAQKRQRDSDTRSKELRAPIVDSSNNFEEDQDNYNHHNNNTYDPYFNATQAFQDASQKSLKSLKNLRDSSSEIQSDIRDNARDSYNSMEWNTSKDETGDLFLANDFADQTNDTCGYCQILANRVRITRCYTCFYLLLFGLGAAVSILAVNGVVHEKKKFGLQFFATYAVLLFLFGVEIVIRFMASKCQRFCHRNFNVIDVCMLSISLITLSMDIVPFTNETINKYIMFSDTCVVVLVTLLIFTRVVVLGCQQHEVVGELEHQDVLMYNNVSAADDLERGDSSIITTANNKANNKANDEKKQMERYETYDYYASHRKHRSLSDGPQSSIKSRRNGGNGGGGKNSNSGSKKNNTSITSRPFVVNTSVKTSIVNLDKQAETIFNSKVLTNNMASYPPLPTKLSGAGIGGAATRASSGARSQSFQSYHQQERSLLGPVAPLRSFITSNASISSIQERMGSTMTDLSGALPVLMEEEDSDEEDVMASVTTTHAGGELYSSDRLPNIRHGPSFDYDERKREDEGGPLLGLLRRK